MVDASYELYYALGDGKKKIEENEKESVIVQQRAVYINRDMEKGEIIKKGDVFPLRPLKKGCVYPYDIEKVIGKKINRNVKSDECLLWEMLEND